MSAAAIGPSAVLLLPRALDGFILADQARDLLRAPRVVAVEPGRVPYGTYARSPEALVGALARAHARGLERAFPPSVRVIAIFHPLQLPVAEVLLARGGGVAELWYFRWDRFECALDAGDALRDRLRALDARARATAALTVAANDALASDGEGERFGETVVVGLAADSFPALSEGELIAKGEAFQNPPQGLVLERSAPVALSLGHLGHRVDWALLRGVAEALPELELRLVGEAHPDELREDADFAACRELSNVRFLGHRFDAEAAALVTGADVGLVPFARTPFNDGGLPYRVLKLARLGRATIAPSLPGAAFWDRALVHADGVDEWVAALRASAGARFAPDLELRAWALAQTAEHIDAPLWARLRELRVAD